VRHQRQDTLFFFNWPYYAQQPLPAGAINLKIEMEPVHV
jgi:hypothetical protein